MPPPTAEPLDARQVLAAAADIGPYFAWSDLDDWRTLTDLPGSAQVAVSRCQGVSIQVAAERA